ncbi:TetR/AcrR family transcriptional regulator [Streptosporangium sp. NPDC000396]|uniref:TetR/AcrR family transcriptional regulator n=1 Tax=Streptosporangium sp. NPDC000396 TaxID=3366185 RepID=UPI00368C504C
METTTTAPMSGRKAQAARNDQVILEAARAVFVADPGAPISAVAERAGVGISALYRRYASKEDLLRKLCSDGLKIYIAEAEAALADEGDPWSAFTGFMRRIVDADTHSLTLNLAGTFTPDEGLHRDAVYAGELSTQIFRRAEEAGALRPGLEVADMTMVFEQLAAIQLGDETRTSQMRHRYLALMLDAMHLASASPLPGPPPGVEEVNRRWTVH